jgi:hypothetical protein
LYSKNIGFIAAKTILVLSSVLSINSFIAVNAQSKTGRNAFNFVAAGDYGCDKKAHETVNHIE